MKKKLTALVLGLSLALAGCNMTPKPSLLPSVMPLQLNGQTFCTAFSINSQEHLWMTAKHCAMVAFRAKQAASIFGVTIGDVTIGSSWATPVYLAPGLDDVAIFQSDLAGYPITLASKAPKVEDAIKIIGFPYGLPVLVTTKGYMAARMLSMEEVGVSDVLDITVAGGNSGSPVLDKHGKLVGILWGRFNASEHSLSVPWETISHLAEAYFEHADGR